jgi:hypothetical protein
MTLRKKEVDVWYPTLSNTDLILHVNNMENDCEKVLNVCGTVLTKYKRTLSLYTPQSQEEEKANKKMYCAIR